MAIVFTVALQPTPPYVSRVTACFTVHMRTPESPERAMCNLQDEND